MISIKAYNEKVFLEFFKKIKAMGEILKIPNKHIYNAIRINNTTITLFKNFTILINGPITNDIETALKTLVRDKFYIGIDEVGVGENIGPLVVCAVKFRNNNDKLEALKLGVKDSKKLNSKQIDEIEKKLIKLVEHECIKLEPKIFNKKWLEIKNVKKMNALIQKQLLDKMYEKNYIPVIDQFVEKKKYFEYLGNQEIKYKNKMIFETKAEDRYLEVASASVIAKFVYNQWVIKYLKKNKIDINLNNKINPNEIYIYLKRNKTKIKEDEFLKEWAKKLI